MAKWSRLTVNWRRRYVGRSALLQTIPQYWQCPHCFSFTSWPFPQWRKVERWPRGEIWASGELGRRQALVQYQWRWGAIDDGDDDIVEAFNKQNTTRMLAPKSRRLCRWNFPWVISAIVLALKESVGRSCITVQIDQNPGSSKYCPLNGYFVSILSFIGNKFKRRQKTQAGNASSMCLECSRLANQQKAKRAVSPM